MRNALLLTILTLVLVIPGAQADYSIANGTIVVHTDGDPGASVAAGGGGQVRVDPDPGCNADLVCATVYGHTMGQNYWILAGGGPSGCHPAPSDCVVVLGIHPSVGTVLLMVHRSGDVLSVCAFASQPGAGGCYGATGSASADPAAPTVCAGVGPTWSYDEEPAQTCEGLTISTSPLCIRRQSDGFAIVCET